MVLLLFKVSLNKALLVELNGFSYRSLDKGKKALMLLKRILKPLPIITKQNETRSWPDRIDSTTLHQAGSDKKSEIKRENFTKKRLIKETLRCSKTKEDAATALTFNCFTAGAKNETQNGQQTFVSYHCCDVIEGLRWNPSCWKNRIPKLSERRNCWSRSQQTEWQVSSVRQWCKIFVCVLFISLARD